MESVPTVLKSVQDRGRQPGVATSPTDSTFPKDDATTVEIVGRNFHHHAVTGHDANKVLAHLARKVCHHPMAVFKLDSKLRVGQCLNDIAFNLNCFFFCHADPTFQTGERLSGMGSTGERKWRVPFARDRETPSGGIGALETGQPADACLICCRAGVMPAVNNTERSCSRSTVELVHHRDSDTIGSCIRAHRRSLRPETQGGIRFAPGTGH